MISKVTFVDSSGLRLVLATDALAQQDGFRFSVIPGSPQAQRIFELVGVLDSIPFEPPPGP